MGVKWRAGQHVGPEGEDRKDGAGGGALRGGPGYGAWVPSPESPP